MNKVNKANFTLQWGMTRLEFSSTHSSLQYEISSTYFAYVSSLFLRSNNRDLALKSATQQKRS